MKSLITKFVAVIFIAVLTVGCASSLTAPVEKIEKKEPKQETNVKPGDALSGESGVNVIRVKPEL